MGFIQAVCDLGLMVKGVEKNINENNDISSYLQLPMPVIDNEKKSGREIRVWLKVKDTNAEMLNILGVSKIDLVEYPHETKEKYLYRDPVSPAASWRFSPVYKLGKGVSDGQKELIGIGSETSCHELKDWLLGIRTVFSSDKVKKEVKANRYFKLKNTLLDAFEADKTFAPGGVNTIMQYLIKYIDEVAERWSDTNRSNILIFGIDDNGCFLYPGEVFALRKYFEKKLHSHMIAADKNKENKKIFCAICGDETSSIITVDKLFAFATFDKVSFLPGAKDISGAKEKVYPVCQNCFSLICEGREKIKDSFRDSQTVPGLNIDVVPELLFDVSRLKKIADQTKNFLHKGIKTEEKRFNRLAEQGEGFVYHFFFWEQNQRQERVHLLVEDVPPTRLKRIWDLWQKTIKVHRSNNEDDVDKVSLDGFFRLLYRVLINLAGKRDEDKKYMRGKWMYITGRLLGGEYIDVYWLKTLMVGRFPGLFADQDWVKRFGRHEVKNMLALIDFFERTNAG